MCMGFEPAIELNWIEALQSALKR